MNTKNSNENLNNDFSNENKNLNPKDFLNSLENFPFIESYQELGFTLKSLCKVTQTTLVMDSSYPNLAVHKPWDIYNILSLIRSLIPDSEWEMLDGLNTEF